MSKPLFSASITPANDKYIARVVYNGQNGSLDASFVAATRQLALESIFEAIKDYEYQDQQVVEEQIIN